VGEFVVLNKEPSLPILLSVSGMVGGAVIAAAYDLSFDAYGYVLVFTNNVFTAFSGVFLKKASSSATVTKTAVLFYNSLLSACALLLFYMLEHVYITTSYDPRPVMHGGSNLRRVGTSGGRGEAAYVSSVMKLWEHEAWSDRGFVLLFIFSAFMGSVLNYSIFLCTTYNSALTTAVVGCLKNILTTYAGMVLFSGYTFSWINFVGINVSVIASLYYTYVTLK
jgi:solute carrier family 35 protein